MSEYFRLMPRPLSEMSIYQECSCRKTVIFMDNGVIVEQGHAKDVIENPKEERTRRFLSRYANS